MNKYLAREEAPIAPETWKIMDAAMAEAAKGILAGRRLLQVEGPFGLGLKAVPLQDAKMEAGLTTSPVVPLSFVHTTFTLSKRNLAGYERDAVSLDLSAVAAAAMECARLEDTLIFEGAHGMAGLLGVQGSNALALSAWDKVGGAAEDIIKAATHLDAAGFHGPYCLALAPSRYNLLLRRYPQGGGTELDHAGLIAAAGVFKAPVLDSGGLMLASGPQFATIVLGQDMAVGFIGPAEEKLEFSISESLALLIRQPGAVCTLKAGPRNKAA